MKRALQILLVGKSTERRDEHYGPHLSYPHSLKVATLTDIKACFVVFERVIFAGLVGGSLSPPAS